MFRLKKTFERKIRSLKSPTSADFDFLQWKAALDACADADAPESRVVAAAALIGSQAGLGRTALDTRKLNALNGEWQTLLAIAALNRDYRTADELVRDQLKAGDKKGAILDDLSAVTVTGAAGSPIGVADLNESSVDAIESWLFDALNSTGEPPASDDLTAAAIEGIRAYSWRKSLNVLWNHVLFQGAYLAKKGKRLFLLPADPNLERLIAACLARQELNLLNYPMIDRQVWMKMKPAQRRKFGMLRSVTAAKRIGGEVKLSVGILPYLSKRLPVYVAERGGLEGSYLAEFLETPMPTDNRITGLILLKAWHVIRDSAEAIVSITPQPTKLTRQSARYTALAVERKELVESLAQALGIDESTADAVLEFLTFRPKTAPTKGHRGLWSSPVVPVPESDLVALALPALATSNPLRKLEGWLEKGGIDDNNPVVSRGDRYEATYRAEICRAVKNNAVFKTARCAEEEIKKTAKFEEQIDLLVAFGGLAVVGEVKFFLTPADPHERSRYFDKLREAAGQAARKADALAARRDVIAAALKMDIVEAQALEVLPIVVTNQGFGFSLELAGVRIVDAYFLKTYLAGGELVSAMAFSGKSSRSAQSGHSYYTTEIAARRQFEAEIAEPYVLSRYLDRVKFRNLTMPLIGVADLEVASAYLDRMDGLDRMNAEALMASIAGR